jgi:hypothetical protein
MSWFSRPTTRFPADMPQRLERFGRFSLDPRSSGIDAGTIWSQCVGPFAAGAKADPDGFLAGLQAAVADRRGGFATFGAARLVWEMYGADALTTPATWPLIDAGIDFIAERGLPTASLTGYEMQRLTQRRAAG